MKMRERRKGSQVQEDRLESVFWNFFEQNNPNNQNLSKIYSTLSAFDILFFYIGEIHKNMDRVTQAG